VEAGRADDWAGEAVSSGREIALDNRATEVSPGVDESSAIPMRIGGRRDLYLVSYTLINVVDLPSILPTYEE